MRRLIIAAAALALTTGASLAQNAPSSADKPAASGQGSQTTDPKQSSPGSTGAMNNATGGVATSPQDVQKQGGAATAPGHGAGQGGDAGAAGAGGDKPK